MSDDETRLLETICAAPDDDAPRLVYADWLLEQSDPRGDLINAQCTRSSCERGGDFTSDRYRAALVAESVALRDVRMAWLRALDVEAISNVAFVRGFPVALGAAPAHLFARWADLALLPLERLIFVQNDRPVTLSDLRRLADQAPIPTLTTLAIAKPGATAHLDLAPILDELPLAGGEPDDTVLWPNDALAPIEPFGELTIALAHSELATYDRGFDEDADPMGAPLIDTRTPFPTSLRALTLSCERIDVELFIMTSIRRLKWLESLELVEAREHLAMAALEDWPHQQLCKLRLEGPGRAVGRRFALSGAAKGLRHLAVSFPLDRLLADALDAAPLETLSVHGGHDTAALEHMLRQHPNLRELEIEGFRGDVAGALVRAAPPQLSILEFRHTRLDLEKLAGWEQRLSSLSLQSCGDAEALLSAPALASIPWIHSERANRAPSPGAFRYLGDVGP